MKGRKPYPYAILNSTNDKDRMTRAALEERKRNEPKTDSAKLNCPKHLCAEAKKEWARIKSLYETLSSPIITDLDVNALEIYCNAVVTYRKAMGKVRESAEVYAARSDGKPRRNPWLTVAGEAAMLIKKYGEVLLLDPTSRARAGLVKKKETELSPIGKFRQNRQNWRNKDD